ncbi:VOC family protein [Paraburkholderia sp. RL17-373-BIF-A]|jgi:catechol 2,3-dioxygenase-like lactoylglutathione lyase family enzyme|uniref:VOC family protein n=1 Tax=Paraburkholderia sp. RL17-373-BIF-A TaxID=3031629 RepID=UPI0038BC8FFD
MSESPPPVLGLHHFAWRCRNAEETRHFYEDIVGLPLVHVIRLDHVPSTGGYCPYVHLFFEMADGSYIAFFDLGDDTAAEPSPNTPPWVNHIALRVATLEQLETMKQRLVEHGIEVLGVTDHHFVRSIYFFDPNGFRLELTVPVAPAETLDSYKLQARPALDAWTAERKNAVSETSAA